MVAFLSISKGLEMFKNFAKFAAVIALLGFAIGCGGPGEATTLEDRPEFGGTPAAELPPIEGLGEDQKPPDGVLPH